MIRLPAIKTRRPAMLCAALLAATWVAAPAHAAPDASSCAAGPEHHTLDFWLGDWTIAATGQPPDATSTVSLDLGQCVVVEHWKGERNHSGENLFGYSAGDQGWHGLFADNEGHVHVFLDGKVTSGSAEFTGPSRGDLGETILNRISIRRVDTNHIEQEWEKSADNGKTWARQFLLQYTRRQQ